MSWSGPVLGLLLLFGPIGCRKQANDEAPTAATGASQELSTEEIDRILLGERTALQTPKGSISYGSEDALVTIVEFVDYECKYCKKLHDTVQHLADKHPEDVRVVIIHAVTPGHLRGLPAAAAALAAQRQGKGREYRKLLFKNRTALAEADLVDYAEKVGLDLQAFDVDRKGDEIAQLLADEGRLATDVGLVETPASFINGLEVGSAPSLADYERTLDQELSSAQELVDKGIPRSRLQASINEFARQRGGGPAAQPEVENPAPTNAVASPDGRYFVPLGPVPPIGPEKAEATVVYFTPASGPQFASAYATLMAIRDKHSDVRVTMRFAVGSDQDKEVAARAGIVAALEGVFWDWAEQVAASPRPIETDQQALALLDALPDAPSDFSSKMDEGATIAVLASEFSRGWDLGIEQQPAVYVNGFKVDGTDTSAIEAVLGDEAALARSLREGAGEIDDPYFAQIRGYARSVRANPPPSPDPFRRPVDVTTLPKRGPNDPQVKIVECVDFECTPCREFSKTLRAIEDRFDGKVASYFLHYPLEIHPKAEPAHRAAVAAGKQDKFWEMHDFLFANPNKREVEDFEAAAVELGLDLEAFKSDLASPQAAKTVADDYERCRSLGVRGSPGILVNGRLVQGAPELETFAEIVTSEIAASGD